MVDIDLVDARRIHRRNRPCHGMFPNARRQQFATLRQQQLGIAQPANAVAALENHRRRHHWSKQRSAPHLVHSCHQDRARIPRLFFIAQGAAQFFQQTQFRRGRRKRKFGCDLRSTWHERNFPPSSRASKIFPQARSEDYLVNNSRRSVFYDHFQWSWVAAW